MSDQLPPPDPPSDPNEPNLPPPDAFRSPGAPYVPTPPTPVPRAMPAARRPARPQAPSSGSSAGMLVAILLGLAAVGGGAWWWHTKNKAVSPVAEETAPEPVVTPKKVEKVEKPAPPKPAEVAATKAPEKPVDAPMPEATTATDPKVAEATPEGPDPFANPLVLDGVAARSAAAEERWGKLLRLTLRDNQWTKYQEWLKTALEVELHKTSSFDSPQRYERYTGNPYFMRALFQHAIGREAGEEARKMIADDERLRQHMTVLMENAELMESLLRALTPGDSFRNAMNTWATLATDDAEAYGKYRELAIACSLVLEKPKTFDWNGKKITVSAQDRFQWYKKKDKAGQLVGKVTEMSAWKLCWVVGVSVPESEMEWAIKEVSHRLKQGDWGNAYTMVPYDMQKAVTGKQTKPYDYYTFAEILKKGGVCADRAYFTTNTARSVGLPAVTLAGDGARGPHAWVAWLSNDDRWTFSGRYEGYAASSVTDPRNGAKISEQRFTRLSNTNAPSDAKSLKAQRLVWISELQNQLGQKAEADQGLEFALKTSPHEADLWEKKIRSWRALVPPVAPLVWKQFLDALRREFRDDTEVLALARKAEDEFVLTKVDAAVAKNELRGDVRDLSKLKGLTSLDEIRTAHQRYAALFIKDNDYAGIRHIYREALDDYGRESAKFKALAHDYWKSIKEGSAEVKTTAARDIEKAYERHVETKGGDFFDVQSQNTAAQEVADTWRKAGDNAKAERIEKEIAKRGKKATKAAL